MEVPAYHTPHRHTPAAAAGTLVAATVAAGTRPPAASPAAYSEFHPPAACCRPSARESAETFAASAGEPGRAAGSSLVRALVGRGSVGAAGSRTFVVAVGVASIAEAAEEVVAVGDVG